MRLYTHLILAIAALFLISACSDDDDPQTTTTNGENITGSWASSCIVESTFSFSSTLTFGSGLSWTAPAYNDTACTTLLYTQNGTTTFTFIGTKTADTGETVSTYDWVDNTATVTPATDTGTAFLISNSTTGGYGFTDWTTGVAKDVLGVSDTGGTDVTSGQGIMYVNSAVSPNTMQLEADGAANGSDGYPDTLDTGLRTKQ